MRIRSNTSLAFVALSIATGTLAGEDRAADNLDRPATFAEARQGLAPSIKSLSGGLNPQSLIPTMEGYASGRSEPPEVERLRDEWERVKGIPYGSSALIRAQKLFFQWGARDFDGAITEGLPLCSPEKGKVDLLAFAVLGGAAVDPDGAWDWVDKFEPVVGQTDIHTKIDLYQAALIGLVVAGREEAALRHWLELNAEMSGQVDEFEARRMDPAGSYALASLSRKDRTAALGWLENSSRELALDRLLSMYEAIWSEMADEDPRMAAEQAARLPEGEIRRSLLEKTVRWWGVEDAVSVSDWMRAQELGSDFDPAIVQLIDSLSDVSLDEMRFWLEALGDPALRNAAIYRSYSSFRALDPAESVFILSLYDPSVERDPNSDLFMFGNAFAWLSEMGEDLACWSAYDTRSALRYLDRIDFLNSEHSALLRERFDYALRGKWKKETISALINRYSSAASRNGVSNWKISIQAMRLFDYMTRDRYDDCLVELARYWAEIEPEVARYFLEQQRVFAGESLERALSVIDTL